ncbi:hypothetical protein CC78DRAFT_282581 [Lojkania enalia]|uniref:Uncharacterized protein n=1 Tax=Lojkania enalia TaxID=147567 RepID=A0A9P4NAC9_9PLEO|nr:hypothetical protein CC78DRAFT_282581 [Didymosphaeria enalia]
MMTPPTEMQEMQLLGPAILCHYVLLEHIFLSVMVVDGDKLPNSSSWGTNWGTAGTQYAVSMPASATASDSDRQTEETQRKTVDRPSKAETEEIGAWPHRACAP